MKGVYARADSEATTERLAILARMQAASTASKIDVTRRIIETALKIGPAAILYSGGRDSTVLLKLVTEQEPRALVLHNNTTLGSLRTLEFIRGFCRELNYRETTAENPLAMWQEKGHFPILSKRGFTAFKKRDPGLKISPVQCCYQLKEKHANGVLQAEQVAVSFWGNRAAESMRRRLTFIDNGFLFKPKKYSWWQAYPLQHWADEDIDRFLRDNVPDYPERAAGFETGCECCGTDLTFWPNNLGRLYQHDRKKWEHYMRAGFAEQIMRIKGIPGEPEDLIKTQPQALLHVNTAEIREKRKGGQNK